MIFELVSYKDLKNVVLACRRWREIGETPRLWSSFPVIVKTRNMSVMSEILSSRRMKQLEKLRIISILSKEVLQTIMDHHVLREFKLSRINDKQTIISLLNIICSREYKGTVLEMNMNNMFYIDPELLAKVVTKLQKLDVMDTNLTQQQTEAIFTAISEGSKMIKLNIAENNISKIDPGLLVKAVTNLQILDVMDTNLTQQQTEDIFTAVSEESKMIELNISENNMSGVDPGLLAKAVNKLETLDIELTQLTHQQAAAILSAVSEGSKLTKLIISSNNLSGVDPGLLAKAVTNLETLNIANTELTQQQAAAILSNVSEGTKLNELNIRSNDLSRVDSGLLAKVVTNLETLYIGNTKLIQEQAVAILSGVINGSKMTELDICLTDLSGVDPGLLAKASTNLETLWKSK